MKFLKKYIYMTFMIFIFGLFSYFGFLQFFLNFSKVNDFCQNIKNHPEYSIHDIKLQTISEDLSFIEDKENNSLMIFSKKTRGKTTCLVIQDDDKLKITYMDD